MEKEQEMKEIQERKISDREKMMSRMNLISQVCLETTQDMANDGSIIFMDKVSELLEWLIYTMLSQGQSIFSLEEISDRKYWNSCDNILFRSPLILRWSIFIRKDPKLQLC